ncbi:MAG: SpoIID/LytB domain-containing protein [Candidatus Caenarcaniphilales bacterium]|nr:SpoIID/LytB domain-containing protein [Candidatus Caenarcaniphilales bacterium]
MWVTNNLGVFKWILKLLLFTILFSVNLSAIAESRIQNVDETVIIRVLIAENIDELSIGNNIFKAKAFKNLSKVLLTNSYSKDFLNLKLCTDVSDKQCEKIKTKGEIYVKKDKNKLDIYNHIKLGDYLNSVMVSEMPSSWHKEALKAQAIAARTYALKQLEISALQDYDLKSTVADQSFKGFANVPSFAKDLVSSTRNQVVLDKYNLLAETYYSSSSGEVTASPEDTWGTNPRHYLINKVNIKEDTSFASWQRIFSCNEIIAKLGVEKSVLNSSAKCPISKINLNAPSEDSAYKLFHYNTIPALNISLIGEELRHKLSLPSTRFEIKELNNKISFIGSGFGHGIGMSQYGAKKLAEMGISYKGILDFYYPGTKLINL